MPEYLLEVENLQVSYGGIKAVRGVSFSLEAGQQGTLIGANGAGKSSTVRAITGQQKFIGDIRWCGESLIRCRPEALLKKGIVMVPEGRGIFSRMTVLENLQMGAWLRKDHTKVRQETEAIFSRYPRLMQRKHQLAGWLSGGEQQLLALSRALLSQPKLLILDEPSMGLAPLMVKDIFQTIAGLRNSGISVLLIEQNARLALEMTDQAWVMDSGTIAVQGKSAELLKSEIVQQIYLGELPVNESQGEIYEAR